MVNDGAYYLSADESPQKGWKIYCARIIGYMWQKGMSEADLIQLKFAECRVERHLPLGPIGKGAEDLTYNVVQHSAQLLARDRILCNIQSGQDHDV